jgi:hypothetical protein
VKVLQISRDEAVPAQRLLLKQVFPDIYRSLDHSPADELVVSSSLAKPAVQRVLAEEGFHLQVLAVVEEAEMSVATVASVVDVAAPVAVSTTVLSVSPTAVDSIA